jgi:hypothetical protein
MMFVMTPSQMLYVIGFATLAEHGHHPCEILRMICRLVQPQSQGLFEEFPRTKLGVPDAFLLFLGRRLEMIPEDGKIRMTPD